MNAVDTNILIYVNDPRDAIKQGIASSLIASMTDGVLLWQVACEYLAASRKLELHLQKILLGEQTKCDRYYYTAR